MGRMYMIQVDDDRAPLPHLVEADHAVDAARIYADRRGWGETLYEGATALGRWTIATADEHRVSAWLAEECADMREERRDGNG